MQQQTLALHEPSRPLSAARRRSPRLGRFAVRHPGATFLARAVDDTLAQRGIAVGDMLVIDRASAPAPGDVVLVEADGACHCREYAGAESVDGCVVGTVVYTVQSAKALKYRRLPEQRRALAAVGH